MIYTQSNANAPLFILSTPSWLDWITPFLKTSTGPSPDFICWEPQAPAPIRLRAALRERVVFLSHHVTLKRDANFAQGKSNMLAQPTCVAVIAHDKAKMGEIAAGVPGLKPIPILTFVQALEYLRSSNSKGVVVKRRAGTEGQGVKAAYSAEALEAIRLEDNHADLIFQPLLEGVEYSVNLIAHGERAKIYAPICKGPNPGFKAHPAKRLRRFPAPVSAAKAQRLMDLAAAYAALIKARGLLEVEFLETDEGIYLVEVNPRLSATLRMAIAGSGENLLLELGALLTPDKPERIQNGSWDHAAIQYVAPTAASLEIPLPKDVSGSALQRLFNLGDVHISSRITMTAPTDADLQRMHASALKILANDREAD